MKFLLPVMILGAMLSTGSGLLGFLKSSANTAVYLDVLDQESGLIFQEDLELVTYITHCNECF